MDDPVTIGSSLPVPHVQALAASLDATSEIPDRYIRTDLVETDPVVDDAVDLELPVVDLRRAQLSREECAKIMGVACEEWGFFQLINHGMPRELMEKMKVDITEFFKLPREEKETFAQLPDGLQGYGQMFVKSEEQKLDWGDVLALSILPRSRRDMRFWPTNPPTFRFRTSTRSSSLSASGWPVPGRCTLRQTSVRRILCSWMVQVHCSLVRVLKMLLLMMMMWRHLTLDSGVWNRTASTLFSSPVDKIFTNGKYKSIEHRAIVNAEKVRLSIAIFHPPDNDCILRPFPQLVEGGVEKYKTSSCADYMKAYFSARLDAKNHLESVKLKN